MERGEKGPLDSFMLADYNLLCADPAVTAGQVRSYLRPKYAQSPHQWTTLLEVEAISQALTAPFIADKRASPRFQLDFTSKRKVPERTPFPIFRRRRQYQSS